MTALGIALTVSVLVAVLALVNGLQSAFKASGNPLNILVMRKGANAELSGGMTIDAFQSLKAKPGIARGADGLPLASLELITVINSAQRYASRRHEHHSARPHPSRPRDSRADENRHGPLVPRGPA